mmetsp:Transcript_46060/g.121448  ORF Transcript_46060/g.121448 Transcript_46060/m.121448 type:complete len:114 (+) Transcript_46060:45-386(+)|eukprot:4548658-Prymnesium_polylepis.3
MRLQRVLLLLALASPSAGIVLRGHPLSHAARGTPHATPNMNVQVARVPVHHDFPQAQEGLPQEMVRGRMVCVARRQPVETQEDPASLFALATIPLAWTLFLTANFASVSAALP